MQNVRKSTYEIRNSIVVFWVEQWKMISGAQVRAARALLGWTAKELARKASVGISTVQRIENAAGPPNVQVSNRWLFMSVILFQVSNSPTVRHPVSACGIDRESDT